VSCKDLDAEIKVRLKAADDLHKRSWAQRRKIETKKHSTANRFYDPNYKAITNEELVAERSNLAHYLDEYNEITDAFCALNAKLAKLEFKIDELMKPTTFIEGVAVVENYSSGIIYTIAVCVDRKDRHAEAYLNAHTHESIGA
jgi:hypothetical protein